MFKTFCLIFISLISHSIYGIEAPKKVFTLGVTKVTLETNQGKFLKAVQTEIFKKLNYQLKVIILPPLRLKQQSKSGKINGELVRMSTFGIGRKYLTRVEEPMMKFSVVSYSANKKIKINSWLDLKNLRVGYRRGILIVENELVKVCKKSNLFNYTDSLQALELLNLGRLDVYVGLEFFIDGILRNMPAKQRSSIYKVKTLKRDSAHTFLNAKFSKLAKKVSKELKLMKENGRYMAIRRKVFSK
ncbi:hypothetical protein A9Q84_16300 [Halobacteriovorax marinus]|uniref:Uncharacterized protein n=1 Tax=Halobacteriovorax marinus TaxID=97084 RepID=A0A1Y5F4S6_9BACT|nr:hypothetical protein A9Q84_16300 [Halobacteriovorax marinus]